MLRAVAPSPFRFVQDPFDKSVACSGPDGSALVKIYWHKEVASPPSQERPSFLTDGGDLGPCSYKGRRPHHALVS
jgi:hypothetical protein